MSQSRFKEARREKFGRALAEAIRLRGMNQFDLGKALMTTQSSVSAWITGKSEPAADTVFDIERCLELAPGALSKHLGYKPADEDARPDTEGTIMEDPFLDQQSKEMLIGSYHVLRRLVGRAAVAEAGGAKRPTAKAKAKAATPAAPAPRKARSVRSAD